MSTIKMNVQDSIEAFIGVAGIIKNKALRQTEFSELFVFASFGNVRLLKFVNFLEKNGIFELAKSSEKSSEFSKNIEKITLNSNFGNRKKLVPTRKPTRKFQFKFGMQGLNQKVPQGTKKIKYPTANLKISTQ